MRKLIFITIALYAAVVCAAVSEYKVDWAALDRAFSAYLQQPGPTTAKQVTSLLPPGKADHHTGAFNLEIAERIFERLEKLEVATKRAQPDAIDVAFALIAISDGHFTEELLTMIAATLDADPNAFLAALTRNQSRPFASCDLALDTGPDYVDDPKGELARLEARLAGIERVSEPELQEQKQCALKSLRATVKTMKANIK